MNDRDHLQAIVDAVDAMDAPTFKSGEYDAAYDAHQHALSAARAHLAQTPALEKWTPETNIIAYGLLSDAQRTAIKAKGPWQMYSGGGEWGKVLPVWNSSIVYRRAPKPDLTQDIIPWNEIDPAIVKTRRTEDDVVFGAVADEFPCTSDWVRLSGVVAGIIPGTCAPEDSLQMRPGGV